MTTSFRTEHAGQKFRSRLEARWSIVFDAMGIAWRYEPRWVQLSDGRYLPDFELAHGNTMAYLEIKPCKVPARSLMRCEELAVQTQRPVLLFAGAFEEGFTAHVWRPAFSVSDPQTLLFDLFGATGWAAASKKARLEKFDDRRGRRPMPQTHWVLPATRSR